MQTYAWMNLLLLRSVLSTLGASPTVQNHVTRIQYRNSTSHTTFALQKQHSNSLGSSSRRVIAALSFSYRDDIETEPEGSTNRNSIVF